jgi:hypothetical protein
VLPDALVLQEGAAESWIGFVGDLLPLQWRGVRFEPEVQDFLKPCSQLIGNFEGVFSEAPWLPFLQRHSPAILDQLHALFPLERWCFSMANNHAGDFGEADFFKTCTRLEAAKAVVFGTIEHPSCQAGPLKIAAWTEYLNRPAPWICSKPSPAPSGLSIAFPHWGREFSRAPVFKNLPGYAAVIGHHPHLVQPVEVRAGQLIAWSLGNFVTEVKLPVMGEGLILRLGVGKTGLIRAELMRLVLDRRDRKWCVVKGQASKGLLPETVPARLFPPAQEAPKEQARFLNSHDPELPQADPTRSRESRHHDDGQDGS